MSIRAPRPPVLKRRLRSVLLWGAAACLVLAVVGVVAGRSAIEAYLQSDRFRQLVASKTGETLKANSEFAPFRFSGTHFYSERFEAEGNEGAVFSKLRADQIRAEVSLRRFFEGAWRMEQLSVQRVDVHFDNTAPRPEQAVSSGGTAVDTSSPGWLPNRLEIGSAIIQETHISWVGGGLRGARLELTQKDGGWLVTGGGGHLQQAGFPSMEVDRVRLRYQEPSVFVQSAELRPEEGGTITLAGEMEPGDRLQLHGVLSGVSVTPWLTGDWRLRLHGSISGEIDVQTPLPVTPGLMMSGHVTLNNGQLEALPVLDQIAIFTRLQQFRTLKLSSASADFRQENGRLAVSNFVAESAGLIRIEGAFTVRDGKIDGVFEVGVTPSSLQWLPGSQERVFTRTRGAYIWAPMRLAGPLDHPEEDLSPRLAAAARGALIHEVEGGVRGTIETGKDVIKGAFDLLKPLIP